MPTAHDEPAIHLDIYKELFSLPAGLAYNTEVERRFLTTHFSIRAVEEETVGCGVDLPAAHPALRDQAPRDGGDGQAEAVAGAPEEDEGPETKTSRRVFARTWRNGARRFDAVIGCTARSRSMAVASTPARAAKN